MHGFGGDAHLELIMQLCTCNAWFNKKDKATLSDNLKLAKNVRSIYFLSPGGVVQRSVSTHWEQNIVGSNPLLV
jgi:hypothetical protein